MGADLMSTDSLFRGLLAQASEAVGADLERICRRGPETELRRSRYVQPLLVCVSLGYAYRLVEAGLNPDLVAGHSLGEVSALALAGVLSAEEAVQVAVCRGQVMEEAASCVAGGMVAVNVQDREAFLDLVQGLAGVVVANDNSPEQLVLSGERDALEEAVERVAVARLGTCRKLAVAGPWHTPFLAAARDAFAARIEEIPFREATVPWISNVTGQAERDPEAIRSLLVRALAEPVRWRACMKTIGQQPIRALLEIGPGRVLSGLARANGFGLETAIHHVNNLRGVEAAVRDLAGTA